MMSLFEGANEYVKESDWKDLSLIKFCLCAIGIMIGINVPREKKKTVLIGASVIFAMTYVPLMSKFIRLMLKSDN